MDEPGPSLYSGKTEAVGVLVAIEILGVGWLAERPAGDPGEAHDSARHDDDTQRKTQ
jgi:hypothetical protein